MAAAAAMVMRAVAMAMMTRMAINPAVNHPVPENKPTHLLRR